MNVLLFCFFYNGQTVKIHRYLTRRIKCYDNNSVLSQKNLKKTSSANHFTFVKNMLWTPIGDIVSEKHEFHRRLHQRRKKSKPPKAIVLENWKPYDIYIFCFPTFSSNFIFPSIDSNKCSIGFSLGALIDWTFVYILPPKGYNCSKTK